MTVYIHTNKNMSNLELIQNTWEIATKSFDKMSNEEKMEWFKSLINNLDENESINWLKDKRNSMTEDQKLKLYKRNAITISWFLKRWTTIYQIYSSITHAAQNRMKNWRKNAAIYGFLEQIPCRFFVELGILNKPEWLSDDKLIEDVKNDAKNFNTYLRICKTICYFIPETKAIIPFIWMAEQYSKRYKDHWTETVIAILNDKKELAIKEQTNQELKEAKENTNKTPQKTT